jgi:hypothetical protein
MATAFGLAAQPLNQLPEMIDRQQQTGRPLQFSTAVDSILDDVLWRPTFAFRLGHPVTAAKLSPRRPVSEVIGPPARLAYDIERARDETAAQDAALAKKTQ